MSDCEASPRAASKFVLGTACYCTYCHGIATGTMPPCSPQYCLLHQDAGELRDRAFSINNIFSSHRSSSRCFFYLTNAVVIVRCRRGIDHGVVRYQKHAALVTQINTAIHTSLPQEPTRPERSASRRQGRRRMSGWPSS